MPRKFFKFWILTGLFILVLNINKVLAQCGLPGTPPCASAAKKTTPKKAPPKTKSVSVSSKARPKTALKTGAVRKKTRTRPNIEAEQDVQEEEIPEQTPQNVNVGIVNSRAISLIKPAYPQAARQANAAGEVRVQVSIDIYGNVTSARAVSGHPLLQTPAENAARQSRFNPIKIADKSVPANGVILYNFINQ